MVIGAGLLSGCIGAPGIPGGPLQGTGATLGLSYGYGAAPTRFTMRSKADGHTESYVDNAASAMNFPILPSRLGGRVGIGKYFDAAGDLAYFDSGVELRAGLPEGSSPVPMALAVGLRSGRWGLTDLENRYSNEQRLRLEAYPSLGKDESTRFNLISSLGASIGRRYYFSRPNSFAEAESDDEVLSLFNPRILRNETRIEGSLGAEMRRNHFFASLVLMPYVVARSSHFSAICRACTDWQPESIQANVGAALFLSFGVSYLLSDLQSDH